MANKSYAEALLKTVFLPDIIRLLYENEVILNRTRRSAKDIRGGDITSVTQIRGEQGISSRPRGGLIHGASPGQYIYASSTLKHHYGALELYSQDKVMSEGNTNERVAAILAEKVVSLGSAFATDLCRQIWGDGTGAMTTVGAAAAEDDIPVDNIQYLREGMPIDVWDTSGGVYVTNGQDLVIVSIDPDTPAIKLCTSDGVTPASITTEIGDVIYRAGNKGYEIEGIQKMIDDDNTYLGIVRSGANEVPRWRSYLMDMSAADLSLIKLDEFFGKLLYTQDSLATAAYTDEPTVRWIKYLYQKQGIPLDYMTINLGYRSIVYTHPKGVTPFIVDLYSPYNNIWVIDERYITLREPQPTHWMPGYDGFWRLVEGYDKEVATLRNYSELFNTNPRTCGRFYNYANPIV